MQVLSFILLLFLSTALFAEETNSFDHLYTKGKESAARCVVNDQGVTRCAANKEGKCQVQDNGHIVCGKGDCVKNKRGNVICAKMPGAQCIIDKSGYGKCSNREDGICTINKFGYATCQ